MKRLAILDIGTNSIKFHVAEKTSNGIKVLLDTNNISRLGDGMTRTGSLSDEAIERNIEALREFMQRGKEEFGVDEFIAVGTMCLRSAKNASDFVSKAKKELGLTINVLPGEEEARLSYLAVVSGVGVGNEDVLIIDTGGGSTEFIFGKADHIAKRFSLDIGAVLITENILLSDPVAPDELQRARTYINGFFDEHKVTGKIQRLVGIGGTVTSLCAVMHKMAVYKPELIQGSKITLEEVSNQIDLYAGKTIDQRKTISGLQPKRADVILAGALIVEAIMKRFAVGDLVVSDRGLRHGLIFEKLG